MGIAGLVLGILSIIIALVGLVPFLTICPSCGAALLAAIGGVCSGGGLYQTGQDVFRPEWEKWVSIAGLALNLVALGIAAVDLVISLVLSGGIL
jgi:hypothetical protein